jgi:hypothetical protein
MHGDIGMYCSIYDTAYMGDGHQSDYDVCNYSKTF